MKSIYYFLLISIFVNNVPAWSQFVISEHSSGISLDEVPYVQHYMKENFSTIRNDENQRVLISNEINNLPTDANSLLNINLEYGNVDRILVMIVNENSYFDLQDTTENFITFNVPDGIYDVIVNFSFNGAEYFVVKELINVSGEATITVNFGEAVNKIVHETVDETNQKMRPGINSHLLIADRSFVFNPINASFLSIQYFWGGNSELDQDPLWTSYISNVSERYSILTYIHGISNERIHYFPQFDAITGVTSSMEITNDHNKFVYYQEIINPTPHGQNSSDLRPAFTSHKLWKNEQISIGSYFENNYPFTTLFKSYLSPTLGTESSNTSTLVSLGFLEDRATNFPIYLLRGNPMFLNNDEVTFTSASLYTQSNYLSRYNFYSDTGQGLFPFHSKFSFPLSNVENMQQGKNTPILSASMRENKLLSGYTGRYGESRESDFLTTTAEIYRNGELMMSDAYTELLNFNFESPSIFEINLLNTNINIDGMNGKNLAQIIFDNSLEDNNPPSLKMLQFRTEEGIVKDYFEQNETPIARLAAGDFYFENSIYLKYKEGNSIEFYYSLMGQEIWNEVELINYPEHFVMPGYGDYYEASLAVIEPVGNDVWYDVKIICTDAAGNQQIQTISPAFKLNSTLQNEEIHEDYDFIVYPNPFSESLNIQLPKNIKGDYLVKLTDLTGKLIHSENKKSSDSKSLFFSFLPQGTYVLSIEIDGKTLAKKVIKK